MRWDVSFFAEKEVIVEDPETFTKSWKSRNASDLTSENRFTNISAKQTPST